MPVLCLIEPDHLTRFRMFHHGRTNRARLQTIVASPLKLHRRLSALSLHFLLISRVEDRLPCKAWPRSVIAHIHIFFFVKGFFNCGVKKRVSLAAFNYRRLPPPGCRKKTTNKNFHWPLLIK